MKITELRKPVDGREYAEVLTVLEDHSRTRQARIVRRLHYQLEAANRKIKKDARGNK